MSRRITKPVYLGKQKVGGTAPISVQSMTKQILEILKVLLIK